MAFKKVNISDTSEWFDFIGEDGTVECKLKIRGRKYQPFITSYDKATKNIQRNAENWLKVGAKELTIEQTLFAISAYHLVADCEGLKVEEKGEEKDFKFNPDNMAELITTIEYNQAVLLWAFIEEKSEEVQKRIDGYKDEVLGKSENSTSGVDTEVTNKPKQQRKSKKQ